MGVGAFLAAPLPNPARALHMRLAVLGLGVDELMVVDGVVFAVFVEATSCFEPFVVSIL